MRDHGFTAEQHPRGLWLEIRVGQTANRALLEREGLLALRGEIDAALSANGGAGQTAPSGSSAAIPDRQGDGRTDALRLRLTDARDQLRVIQIGIESDGCDAEWAAGVAAREVERIDKFLSD